MKLSKRSISFPILSLSALALTVLGGFPAGPFAAAAANADMEYDVEELARVSPTDFDLQQDVSPASSGTLGIGQFGVTVISTGLGVASARTALQQNTIARQRSRVHSAPVHDGSLEQMRAIPRHTLREMILKNTVVGDVVRLEYIAGNEATLTAAVGELQYGKSQWEVRVSKLNAEHTVLASQLAEVKRTYSGVPLSDQSRGLRSHYLQRVKDLEKQLAEQKRVLADADMRMHAARGQYHAANMTLESVRKAHHTMPAGYHVIRDILVDHKTATDLDVFFLKNLGVSQLVPMNMNVPHVRIVRIQIPNVALAAKAARFAKAGAAGVVVAGGIVIEELTVGAIGDSLTKSAETQLSPEARTAPRR